MYEIDFHRVGEGSKSGDAITLRYQKNGTWHVVVVDGGYTGTGEALCEHIKKYYQTRHVDYVISTHPDNDHMCGLRPILENLSVGQLWMHVPRVHAEAILPLFHSRRWLAPNLTEELESKYFYVEELIDLARRQRTPVYEPYSGSRIGAFTVLSPTKEMYEGLLPQFRDTPKPDQDRLQRLGHWLAGIGRRPGSPEIRDVYEDWDTETLLDGGITSAENESSVVLLGELPGRTLLLTGDVGLKGLNAAAHFALSIGKTIQRPNIFQVPHHGSRNNISPAWLDYIVGPVVAQGAKAPVNCVVSAGAEDQHHPRQVVVNALQRRGAPPQSTKQGMLYFHGAGLPGRGWGLSPSLLFDPFVERYN